VRVASPVTAASPSLFPARTEQVKRILHAERLSKALQHAEIHALGHLPRSAVCGRPHETDLAGPWIQLRNVTPAGTGGRAGQRCRRCTMQAATMGTMPREVTMRPWNERARSPVLEADTWRATPTRARQDQLRLGVPVRERDAVARFRVRQMTAAREVDHEEQYREHEGHGHREDRGSQSYSVPRLCDWPTGDLPTSAVVTSDTAGHSGAGPAFTVNAVVTVCGLLLAPGALTDTVAE
jgi:hypothetical protein